MLMFPGEDGWLSYPRLQALSEASELVSRELSRLDRLAALDRLAHLIHDLFDAECAAVFLAEDGARLVLQAASTDLTDSEVSPLTLKVRSVPGGGLTGHAATGQTVRLHGADLINSPFVASQPAEHLVGGTCRSTMILPLRDRKGHLLAVLKLDNKKSLPGHFTGEDEYLAGLLGHLIMVVLEKHRDFQVNRTLARDVREATTAANIFAAFLKASAARVRADRADLFFWDEVAGGLRVRLRHGDDGLRPESRPPRGSPCWDVWRTGQEKLVGDFGRNPDLRPVAESTRSALTIPLKGIYWQGVLNLESGQAENFDEHDAHDISVLWDYAAISARMVDDDAARRVPAGPRRRQLHDRSGEFQGILKNVQESFGYEAGVIYVPNFEEKKLVCLARIGCDSPPLGLAEPVYEFGKKAFVTWVFEEKQAHYSANPRDDDNVSPDGVRYFRIHGPMLGVPLVYRGTVLGVLIVWSRNRGPRPTPEDRHRLQPFASLAAAKILLSESERQRSWVLRHLQGILSRTQQQISGEAALRAVVKGVMEFGFDRVLAFAYDEHTQCFTPLDSEGLADPGAFLRHGTLHAPSNPYVLDTVKTAAHDPWTRVYDPTDGRWGGSDPDGQRLEKPADLSWAVVPLVLMGKLYGQLLADFAHTRQEITEDHREYLTAIGAIAAGVIANGSIVRLLSAPALPILYSRLNARDPKLIVVLRLLAYLTCGEGLGFSRGLFFEFDRRTRRLTFSAGVGSLTKERFELIAGIADGMTLVEILDRVGQFNDDELNNTLAGLSFDADDPQLAPMLREPSAWLFGAESRASWPDWLKALAGRTFETDHALAAPLRLGDDLFGLFVADRRWRREVGEVDKVALRTYAQQAAHILKRHALELEVDRARQGEAWQAVSHEASHELGYPISLLDVLIKDLPPLLGSGGTGEATQFVTTMTKASELIKNSQKRLLDLVGAQRIEPQPVVLRTILEDSLIVVPPHVERSITFAAGCPEDLRVYVDAGRLRMCFGELVENASYWFDKVHKVHKRIAIEVRLPSRSSLPPSLDSSRRYALIEFADNGPGVSHDVKGTLFEPNVTARPKDKDTTAHGLGLFLVWQVIDRHGGLIVECGNSEPGPNQGATFHIHLPLTGERPAPPDETGAGQGGDER
jgi:signal transduction histidine kinase